jgi:histidine triad (HIT) family protein
MTTQADPNCVFCKIVAREVPADLVYEDDEVLAFKDIHPQAPTHLLVIPKTHIATLNDFGGERRDLAGSLLLTARKLAAERSLPGYRVVMNVNREGGQVVFHAHLHLLGGRPMKGSLG